MVGIHHDLAFFALLSHVSPGVPTAPVVVTFGTAKLTPHPPLALVGGCLLPVVLVAGSFPLLWWFWIELYITDHCSAIGSQQKCRVSLPNSFVIIAYL